MERTFAEIERVAAAGTILGYLNFSDGRPDARWQKQLHDAFEVLVAAALPRPWAALHGWLASRLDTLASSGTAAFRDVRQARAALDLFARTLPAYRDFHADLLAHQSDSDLIQAFFLVRVFEAVLAELAAAGPDAAAVDGVLQRLNDFVGYRPVAILETRPRGEAYPHERHRPVPLYLRGAGVSRNKYHDIVQIALDLLGATDKGLQAAAHFDPNLLDELALDLRAYDHGHPVNRRPNYVFGEWDPHHIDNQGRYTRYVIRQITLDGLLHRLANPGDRDLNELKYEAGAVFAGTILMACGISGWGPGAHESGNSLAVLMPRIARYRDEFYQKLLTRLTGTHAERLRQEQALTRQPFGGARQSLNAYLARHRAAQMQQRYLALLFAEMGYPDASHAEARRIPTASVRFLSEILSRLSTGHREVEHGQLSAAAAVLPEIEGLMHRGIACGALADPWNVLGFQALFPLSPAQEDSLRDPRLDELIQVVDQTFNLYARVSSEAAAAGEASLVDRLGHGLKALGVWWDRFATVEVADVRRVHGEEAAASAAHVAEALGLWHDRGEAAGDLAFWREHLDSFRTPKAFALVVDALLRKQDYRAAMALLISWVGKAGEVSLEDGPHSFHNLALRWLLGVTVAPGTGRDLALVQKFFDYLEANAEDFWRVPLMEAELLPEPSPAEDLYSAAYEDVTYRDSTDDANESDVVGGDAGPGFDLEEQGRELEQRLRFLSVVARLWVVAARAISPGDEATPRPSQTQGVPLSPARSLSIDGWLNTAGQNLDRLLALTDAIQSIPVPAAEGNYESLVEYDRQRVFKEQLLYTAIGTCLDTTLAVGALAGAQLAAGDEAATPLVGWGPQVLRLERALFRGEVADTRQSLAEFVEKFREEPLLFAPLAEGGQPRDILRVRVAQAMLRVLLLNLPRLGLLRETYELLRTARAMEQNRPPQGRGITEFGQYFQAGFAEVVESAVGSAEEWGPGFEETRLAPLLERLTAPFLALWVEHSRSVQLSTVEMLGDEAEWDRIRDFVRRYGSDLFHARFMTLGNLRGVLHRGVEAYLEYLRQDVDPLRPVKLVDELDRSISPADAARRLEFVLRAVVENYEEYKDFNATTSQSDYGENLYVLLDFLRLKAAYERHAWEFRPLVLVHEVLARRGRRTAALSWERTFTRLTNDLARQYLEKLGEIEKARGVRLNTVGDRLHERFVKPLALDRLRALIEPAMNESRLGGPSPSFARLQEELQAYTATPTGVGLDVPAWLRALEADVHRVQASRTTLATMAEAFYRVPRRSVSLDELKRQLDEWDRGRRR